MRLSDFLKRLFKKRSVQEIAENVKSVPEVVDSEPALVQENGQDICPSIKRRFSPTLIRAEINSIEFMLDKMEEKRINKQIFKERFLPTNVRDDEEDYFYLQ